MSDRIAVVLGDGQIAAQCAEAIAGHGAFTLPLVVHHRSAQQWSSQIEKFGKEHGVRTLLVGNVNDAEAVRAVADVHPDIIFSVNNWDVIRAELLAVPAGGIVNFHNGPLPAYRGVNAPSWAIINGERKHGVTWHFVSAAVDAGDVVATDSFELRDDETAISLIFRCMEAGLRLLPPLLDQYASGRLEGRPQEGRARYYSYRDSPNQGYLDFNRSFESLSALVRGLTFRPFENLFTWPKIRVPGGDVLVSEISRLDDCRPGENRVCGEIRSVEDGAIVACAKDGSVRLSGLMKQDLADLGDVAALEACGLTVGSVLRVARETGSCSVR